MEFQRHGKYPPKSVGLQAARRDKALRIKDGPSDPKPICPMTLLRCEEHPILIIKIIEVEYPHIQLIHHWQDALIFHNLLGGRIASFSKADGFRPHLPHLLHQGRKGIVVR